MSCVLTHCCHHRTAGLGFATTAPALYSPSIAPASANAASDAKYNYNNNINTVDSLDVNNLGADDNSVTSSSSSGIVSIARLAHHRLAAAEGAGDATGVDISVVGVGGGGGGGGKQKSQRQVPLILTKPVSSPPPPPGLATMNLRRSTTG